PTTRPGDATVFAELARRHGDFALVGLAGIVTARGGCIDAARLVYFGCVDRAKLAPAVGAALVGIATPQPDASTVKQAIRQDLVPDDSPGLRADTKLHLATVLTHRMLNSLAGEVAA